MIEKTKKTEFERLVPNQQSPGEMLKRARESKNLSHIEVAKRLKLRVQWVVDIENDHYKDAAALVYVRGYLSSYAKLVGLSATEILEVFNTMNFDEPFRARKNPTVGDEQFVTRQRRSLSYSNSRSSKRGFKIRKGISVNLTQIILSIVIVTFVVLVALWWRGQKVDIKPVTDAPSVVLPETSALSPEDASASANVNPNPIVNAG